jgi:hypothetical protein
MRSRLRSCISFANVVSMLALFVALGGVSYAAVKLPAGSVGTAQLKRHAVIGRKVAGHTLGMRVMGPHVSAALGAARIRWSARAVESPRRTVLFHLGGVRLEATCQQNAPGDPTNLVFDVTPSQPTTLDDSFGNDSGTDPHSPGAVTPGTLRFHLPANVRTQLGGPGAGSTHYFRNFATAIFTSRSHTVVATVIAIADGTAARCSATGAAYLADTITR